jgi:hypothetical protein
MRLTSTHLAPRGAPALTLLGTEAMRAVIEYVDWKLRGPRPEARGDGHPVVVFPGLGATQRSVAPLTQFCRNLGYAACDWGRGLNRGPRGHLDDWLAGLVGDVERLCAAHTQPITLIGWSLGGIYARELAKIMQARVRRVITIGTPFAGGPQHTHAALAYALLSGKQVRHDAAMARRLLLPPQVPTTCIYSRSDGVVAWQTCVQPDAPAHVENVEVPGSHCGMGWNRHVLDVVAQRLALPHPLDGTAPCGRSGRRGTEAGPRHGRLSQRGNRPESPGVRIAICRT